ncbi:MAG TPA: DUF1573 domain-containing protein [Chitinophagaceae bacterium]|nr:DUF1573 domain-containing protein [Chitinophagaceae bacterium]
MKKILLLATAFAFTLGAMAQPKPEDVMKMNVETHDFGKIKQGEPVTFVFEIKNISDKPLVVESTSASCGCTTPEKPTEPIMPGTVGKVKVVYNAAAAAPFTKDVFIKLAGVDAQKIVHITGEVLTAEAYEAYKKEKKPGDEQPQAKATEPATKAAGKTSTTPAGKPKFTKE